MQVWEVQEFREGFWFGVVATIALLLVALAMSARARRRPLPLGGAVIAVGGLWSLTNNRDVPAAVLVGVVGVGAIGVLSHTRRVSRWICMALALPFAWAIGFHGDLITDVWARLLVTAGVSAGAILVADFDDTWRVEAPGLPLFVVTLVGVYATVPDTEFVAAGLGASLPLLVLGWPARLASLGRPGGAAAVALLVWTGAAGGGGRPASIVAVVACLGLLIGVPVGNQLLPRASDRLLRISEGPLLVLLVVSHVVIVATAARVAGQLSDPLAAATFSMLTGAAATLIGAMFQPHSHAVAPTRVD
jgi:hypothetical protein